MLGWRQEIETGRDDASPFETFAKLARARTDFQDPVSRLNEGTNGPLKPPVVAHASVDEPKIAATVHCIGVMGRKRVEELRLNRARHA